MFRLVVDFAEGRFQMKIYAELRELSHEMPRDNSASHLAKIVGDLNKAFLFRFCSLLLQVCFLFNPFFPVVTFPGLRSTLPTFSKKRKPLGGSSVGLKNAKQVPLPPCDIRVYTKWWLAIVEWSFPRLTNRQPSLSEKIKRTSVLVIIRERC